MVSLGTQQLVCTGKRGAGGPAPPHITARHATLLMTSHHVTDDVIAH